MMLEEIPIRYIGIKHRKTETGIVRMGTIAEGRCQRNKRITRLTMIISRTSSLFKLAMDFSIKVERS